MHRFVRALGAVAVVALMSTGLAVGVSTPTQAQGVDVCAVTDGSLGGTGMVGSPLVADLPTWSLGVLSQETTWLRDGAPFQTGGTSYTPTADDIGRSISVEQAVTLVGLIDCTWVSNAISVVADGGSGGGSGDPVLSLVNTLSLIGGPQVGQLVSVTEPIWSQTGVTTTYQWLRDTAPIPGATDPTYILSPEDAGHAIAAQVTGTLSGFPVVTQVTDALDVPLTDTPALTPVGDVTITGTKKIGTQLGLTGPTWEPADATSEYQWLRDGSPIGGATAKTYTLGAEDFGHTVAVAVTGHKDGYTDGTITSDPIDPVIGDAIVFTAKPGITGTGKIGRLLTADPGEWSGGREGSVPPVFTYQWLRANTPIPGAVAQTYQVDRADAGKAISVLVSATRPAYKPGKFYTSPVMVAKLGSKLTAKAPRKVVRKGQAAVMKLVVKVAGVASPTGRVVVLDGKKKVQKAAFAKGKHGRLTVKISKLKPGLHKLRAVYAGTPTISGARSKVVRLTVRR